MMARLNGFQCEQQHGVCVCVCLPLRTLAPSAFPFHQRPSATSSTPFPSAAAAPPSRELITNLRAFMPTNCHVFSQVTAQLSRA